MAATGGNHGFRRRVGAVLAAIGLVSALAGVFASSASATLGGGSPYDGSDGVLDLHASIQTISDTPSGKSDSSYAGGTKENDLCPAVGDGGVPPNQDLVSYSVGVAKGTTDHFLYLAWRRAHQPSLATANATLDFELNRSTADCGNGVNAVRSAGDLFVQYNFEGGVVHTIQIRTWDAATNTWGAATDLTPSQSEASIDTTNFDFGELVINLEQAGIFQRGVCTNFAQAFVKARSSASSFDNQLKDVVAPTPRSVSNCGSLTVQKTTVGGTGAFTFDVDCNDGTAHDATDVPLSTATKNPNSVVVFDDIPFGTQCTVVEDDPGTSWSTDPANRTRVVTITEAGANRAEFTNTLVVSSLQIKKTTVNGTGTFTFDVDCDGTAHDAADVAVDTTGTNPNTVTAVTGVPVGTNCTVTEDQPGPDWTTDPASRQRQATIVAGPNVVEFTNTLALADLDIRKTTVNGTGTFLFDVNCDGSAHDASDVPVATTNQNPNTVTAVRGIPVGTTCTVVEEDPGADWTTDPVSRIRQITITSGANRVDFTNTKAEAAPPLPPPPGTGSLTVTKAVLNGAGGETFDFGIVCGALSRIVTLGDGGSTTVDDIPLGTTCTVVEQEPADTETETWTTVVTDSDGAADGVVVVDGAETVTFTNTRTVVQPVVITTTTTAPPPPEPTVLPSVVERELPRTGAEMADFLLVGGVAILLGGMLLMVGDRTAPVRVRRTR